MRIAIAGAVNDVVWSSLANLRLRRRPLRYRYHRPPVPTVTPQLEPTATTEPEPTNTPAPQVKAVEVEPTATPEPEPTATSTPDSYEHTNRNFNSDRYSPSGNTNQHGSPTNRYTPVPPTNTPTPTDTPEPTYTPTPTDTPLPEPTSVYTTEEPSPTTPNLPILLSRLPTRPNQPLLTLLSRQHQHSHPNQHPLTRPHQNLRQLTHQSLLQPQHRPRNQSHRDLSHPTSSYLPSQPAVATPYPSSEMKNPSSLSSTVASSDRTVARS